MMGGVFVAGSINMDVVATASRHPKIGETVAGSSVLYFPGGKGANQAVAAAKLGAPTTLIGRLGQDAFGRDLKAFLAAQGIDLGLVRESPEAHSGTAIITVADADNTIVVIPGANALVSAADVATATLATGDVAVSQFEIPQPAIKAFFARARLAGARTILNPAPMVVFDRELLDLVDILILNETELGVLTNTELRDGDDIDQFFDAARSLGTSTDRVICVTLGKRGVISLVNGVPLLISGRPVKAIDTTGAGDCFVGAVAAVLADGNPIQSALGYANVAASVCVQRMGAAPSMPTVDEVKAALRG
jgi:ribokinase